MVAGLATRAVILRRQREEEEAALIGDPYRSPQQAADRQELPPHAGRSSGNGGGTSYQAQGAGNSFFKPEPSSTPRSNNQKTDTPKEIAELTDKGISAAAKASASKSAASSDATSTTATSSPAKAEPESIAPMSEKSPSMPLPSKDIGHEKGKELAESPSEEQLKFAADLSHKLEQIEAMVEKSEPELEGPYCRPSTLKVYMDSLHTVSQIKEGRTKLEQSASPEQRKKALLVADKILSNLHTNWQQLMADQQAGQRASTVISSSQHVLSSYKAPDGLNVDLALAKYSLETAERSMQEHKYDDAFEKAGAIGMLVGMAEVRAGIDNELKELDKNSDLKDKTDAVRQSLKEADAYLSDASKAFVDDSLAEGEYLIRLQHAFQKTTQAQQELMQAKL